jgi:hypothetical protein
MLGIGSQSFFYQLTESARKPGRKILHWPILFALLISNQPTLAQEPCHDLGIQTVNWVSPENYNPGVLVLGVTPGCAAYGLGVRAGEIITGFNGRPVANQYDLEKLAANQDASQPFSITLKNASGTERILTRGTLPASQVSEIAYRPTKVISNEWFTWLKWAGVFLLMSLTVTPLVWYMLKHNVVRFAAVGAATAMYDEFRKGGRNYIEAGVNGAMITLVGVLVIVLIGPIGLAYNLHQPLLAMAGDADRKICCVINEGDYALSPDGRWLVMARRTPSRYFGMGDKIARAPYVAAMIQLDTGKFVSWQDAEGGRWRGIDDPAGSGMDSVLFDFADGRPYVRLNSGFIKPVEPAGQQIFPAREEPAASPEVRYRLVSDEGGAFVFKDVGTGTFINLKPATPYDKWWLSADGRVLALANRPYQPDEKYDGWFTRTYHHLRNLLLGNWSVTFWDVGRQRQLTRYQGYGYDERRWEDGRFLNASLDGRRWIMVRDNGIAYLFDLSGKLEPPRITGNKVGPIYQPQGQTSEITLYTETETPRPENLKTLTSLVGRYPVEILEKVPQIEGELKATLGLSYGPLTEVLTVETPARATPDGGLTYTVCKAHACGDVRLVVHVSPSFQVSALLFHDEAEINLPETPIEGELNPDPWSRLALYEPAAYPARMPFHLYQAAADELAGIDKALPDQRRLEVSPRFVVVGKLQ